MDASGVIQLIILIVLVLLSAFFSSAETAFSTVNRVRMKALEDEGNKKAKKVNLILDNYSKMISTILIGNNIVNIAASSLATTLAIRINLIIGIATGILTIVVLLFGEIIPKTWANLYNESISLVYGPIIYFLMQALTPVIIVVDFLSKAIMRLLHIDPNKKISTMTEGELKTYVDVSHEDGVIETEEREIIYNVFDFSDAVAKDIMIPRINMVTVNVNANYDKVFSVFKDSMYTRIPVYEEDKDNIIGLINIKDFLLTPNPENFSVRNILRKAHYTYEFKKSADLMLELRDSTSSVAFVLNEYGATIGMITLEDLLEEIVGEIRDEYDADEAEFIQEIGERTYLVEGSMKLDDINDALSTQLDSEDYDSIGGIIIEHLDRLPEEGEEVFLSDGTSLKVMHIDQNRITQVQLILPETNSSEHISTEETDKSSTQEI
ncbi:MAG: HlyC/CorC family transporter [Lachnospiraceae bacterium]|nr:HlyC/CorC family transporter [Lachnospiraceae bacterium]